MFVLYGIILLSYEYFDIEKNVVVVVFVVVVVYGSMIIQLPIMSKTRENQ